MPGLDDAGMDRADRDLVQRLALGGEEGIGIGRPFRAGIERKDEWEGADEKAPVPTVFAACSGSKPKLAS